MTAARSVNGRCAGWLRSAARRRGAAWLMVWLCLWGATAAANPLSLYQQRAAYRQALADLEAGRLSAFEQARMNLADYPLAPYLEYYRLRARLGSISDADMAQFQSRYGELPAAGILHYQWLKQLGARGDWQRLLGSFRPTSDAELRCYQLRALLATGQGDQALPDVGELWTVGYSQPKACDPVFDTWLGAGLLTDQQAWERLRLALEAGQTRLGRYLLRFQNGPQAPWAQALYQVHVDPVRVARSGVFGEDNAYARTVIGHGIERLAERDPALARAAWTRYQDSHAFGPEQILHIEERLLLTAARRGEFPEQRLAGHTPEFVEAMADLALRDEHWRELLYWVDQLPQAGQADLRWQYWKARALVRTGLGAQQARETYEQLADERNYYGFLAAEQVGRESRMNPASQPLDPARLADVRRYPPMRRALELHAVGDELNARREWYAALPALDPLGQYHAARLALQEGWLAQSILTANEADLHDNLELRFPLAYTELFERTSQQTSVSEPFLFAVARQESAFAANARSSANARGLMQLIHPTATRVAQRIGAAQPSVTDLYDPQINVALGGHYLADLLARYDRRRPLAAAAYNAGEHRVDRWVRDRKGQPMDVWIEDIPFRETRNYVKNVMAFTQVYARLLGKPVAMLEPHEAAID